MTQPASDPAFRRYLQVQRQHDRELLRMLERTATDIRRRLRTLSLQEGIGARVREAQLRAALGAVHDEMTTLWRRDVPDVVLRGARAAAEAAEIAVETISRVAYASLPDRAAETLTDGLRASARAGIDAQYARVPRALSARVYRNGVVANGIIDDMVARGLSQGLSARELAANVYRFVSPTTPGGASYAAMRLARTEINNAFHEQQKKVGEMPGVRGIKWNLSGSHPRPDECNIFAERNHARLGAGVYRVGQVPDKPHPHCFCYLTYVTLTAAEFASELEAGTFDDELRRRIGRNLELIKERA